MYCLNCNKQISKRSKYCSNKCQKEYQYKIYINKWKNKEENGMRGVRTYKGANLNHGRKTRNKYS